MSKDCADKNHSSHTSPLRHTNYKQMRITNNSNSNAKKTSNHDRTIQCQRCEAIVEICDNVMDLVTVATVTKHTVL